MVVYLATMARYSGLMGRMKEMKERKETFC